MGERSGLDTGPTSPMPIPDATPGEGPTPITVGGRTRAEYEADLVRRHGPEYLEANEGFLDKEWAYMVATFGD
jgi:hypothetical protein